MDDDEAFDELMAFLRERGTVHDDRDGGVTTISAYDAIPSFHTLRLRLTPRSLGDHLRRMAPTATIVFPDVDPLRAAWQLFTVHVDEAIHTAPPGRTDLIPDDGGVRALAPEPNSR